MAAKTIVTFHPDVACDLCGRRLLRGERPDVFLGGGQRRMVCELCAPRANHEGWRREVDEQLASPHAQHPQRSRSLLGRLRQRREPVRAPNVGPSASAPELTRELRARGAAPQGAGSQIEWAGIESEWSGAEEDWNGAPGGSDGTVDQHAPDAMGKLVAGAQARTAELGYEPDDTPPARAGAGPDASDGGAEPEVRRALEIFNAGEAPRRVAGVARSLGPAVVRATSVGGNVAIVVAWELCWYRYEIDLDDEAAGVRIAAEGMELEELADEDRVANAAADEHGMLSLLSL